MCDYHYSSVFLLFYIIWVHFTIRVSRLVIYILIFPEFQGPPFGASPKMAAKRQNNRASGFYALDFKSPTLGYLLIKIQFTPDFI